MALDSVKGSAETITAFDAAAHQHLLKLDPALVKEISKKSIDLIFLDFTAAEGRLRVTNKKLAYELRQIGQDEQVQRVKEKLNEYDRFGTIAWATLAGGLAVAGAFSGANTAGYIICQGMSQVATSTGQHFDSKSKGNIDSLDHRYQFEGSVAQERTQIMREEDQQFDRTLSVVDRAHQATQKAFDALASGA